MAGAQWTVNTISDLRGLTGSSRPYVAVDGYRAAGDGGGGTFFFVSTDSTSPDNGGTIIVSSAGSRFFRVPDRGPLSVAVFGADPTGALDSSPAFTGALSVSFDIYIPPGRYSLSSQLNYVFSSTISSLRMEGAGQDNSVLLWAGGSGLVFSMQGGSSVHLKNFTILAGQNGSGTAITLSGASTTPTDPSNTIENISIYGSDGYQQTNHFAVGVSVSSVSNLVVNNLVIYGSGNTPGGIGISLTGSSGGSIVYQINNCTFDFLDTGIQIGRNIQGVYITSSTFTGSNYGLSTLTGDSSSKDSLSVVNCQFNCIKYGIYLPSKMNDTLLSNNYFLVTYASAQCAAVTGSNFLIFSGNSFISTLNGALSTSGISLTICNYCMVTGNVFTALNTAITLGSGTTFFNIQSNLYANNTIKITNSSGNTCNTIGGGSQ